MKKFLPIMAVAVAALSSSVAWSATGESPTEQARAMYLTAETCAQALRTEILPQVVAGTFLKGVESSNPYMPADMEFAQTHFSPHIDAAQNSGNSSDDACFIRMVADSVFGGTLDYDGFTAQGVVDALLGVTDFSPVRADMSPSAGDVEHKAYGQFMYDLKVWPKEFAGITD